MAAISNRSSSLAFPISIEKEKLNAVHKLESRNAIHIPHLFSYVREFLSLREIFQATVNRSARANTTAVVRAQLRARISNSLKELRIYQRLLKMGLEDLSSVLQYCGRVVHLDCSFQEMNDALLLSLNRYLPNLRSINLMGCKNITSRGYISFFERNPQLHSIHLNDAAIDEVVLQKLVQFCPDLASISIDYCNGPAHLNVLALCRKLTSVHISHMCAEDLTALNIFAKCQNLTQVTLPSFCNTDSYLRSLTQRSSKLISINLTHQYFTEITFSAFINRCKNLQELDVQDCHQLTDWIIRVLIVGNLRHLKVVNVSNCPGITKRAIVALRKKYPTVNVISIKYSDTNPKAHVKTSEKISAKTSLCQTLFSWL